MSDTDTVALGTPSQEAPRAAAPVLAGAAVPKYRRISPLYLLPMIASAFIAIWGGWVGLGQMTGFGVIQLLPGIWDSLKINSSITLPLGMEAYAAYAIKAFVTAGINPKAKQFAKWTAGGAFASGLLGQVTFHLLAAAHVTVAPWPVTMLVSCVPVLVLAMAVTLWHLLDDDGPAVAPVAVPAPAVAPVVPTAPAMPSYRTVGDSKPPAAPAPIPPASSPAPVPARTLEDTQPMPVMVPPLSAQRRSKADTLAAINRVKRRDPNATQGQIAAEIGCSDRWVREVLRSA